LFGGFTKVKIGQCWQVCTSVCEFGTTFLGDFSFKIAIAVTAAGNATGNPIPNVKIPGKTNPKNILQFWWWLNFFLYCGADFTIFHAGKTITPFSSCGALK
jgi:hypothetical protein